MDGTGSSDLTFKIGADAAEAQRALGNFRALMTRELGAMGNQFGSWANTTAGALLNVKTAMLAGGAALVAGVVAAGAGLAGAAKRAAEYADEIDDARAVTGIAVEELSKLRYTARMNDVSFGELTQAMRFFARSIDEARKGTGEQYEAFRRMGFSQAELLAGTKDILPWLNRVSDAFARNADATQKATVARTLYGRGAGPDFIDMLSRGSDVLEKFNQRAAEMGQILTEKDIEAAQRFRTEMKDLEARMQALELTAGKASMGMVTWWTRVKAALMETVTKEEDLPWWITWTPLSVGAMIAKARNAYVRIGQELEEAMKAALTKTPKAFEPPKVEAKTFTDFEALSTLLGRVRMSLAGMHGEEVRVEAETARMGEEIWKASERLRELHKEGKLTGEVFARESAALAALPAAVKKLTDEQWKAIVEGREKALGEARRGLEAELFGLTPESWEKQHAAVRQWAAERRRQMTEERTLMEENARQLALIEAGKHQQIEAERGEAFRLELVQMQRHLAEMVTANFTARERLAWQYEQDLEKLSEVEEAKSLLTATSEAQREATRQQYDINREAALKRYEVQLQALRNSEGWQGFFGAKFAELIRGNEELSRAWAERTERSMLDVRVATAGLSEMGRRAFEGFAEGMGAAGAEALIYGKSFGAAMRETTAQALASLGAQSLAYAIFYTALGFARLAEFLPGSAAQAFKAAGLFTAAGLTAGALGRVMAGQGTGTGGAGGGGGGVTGQAGGAGAPGGQERRQGAINIYISGHVVGRAGIEELTEMINEAVKDRDVRVVATEVKRGGRVIR